MARILLVDDDANVVAINRQALETGGYAVTTASTTTEAHAAIGREMPDVVVLEAMLDGATAGFDLARSLAHENPDLPLIMLSRVDESLSASERASQDRDDGWMPVTRFMEKPVAPDVLVYEVDHLAKAGH
jgi:two-component system phosphate regulon response regulator OmpR